MPWRTLRAGSRRLVARNLDLRVAGLEHLPGSGPVVVAARHFHHFYDGAALVATIPRPVHVLVTLDWLEGGPGNVLMGGLCRAARWPAVVRTDPYTRERRGYDPEAARSIFRRAAADALALLREGRVLVVFPEGYPNVDPSGSPKVGDDAFLPFQNGFVRIAQIAERAGVSPVPIVPVGFAYERGDRWRVALRFGEPVRAGRDTEAARAEVEQRVRALSGLDR